MKTYTFFLASMCPVMPFYFITLWYVGFPLNDDQRYNFIYLHFFYYNKTLTILITIRTLCKIRIILYFPFGKAKEIVCYDYYAARDFISNPPCRGDVLSCPVPGQLCRAGRSFGGSLARIAVGLFAELSEFPGLATRRS